MVLVFEIVGLAFMLALGVVFLVGYLRSRNLGFILLLIGIPTWGIVWRLASSSIHSAVLNYASSRGGALSFGDTITALTFAFNAVGLVIALSGALLLVGSWPERGGATTSAREMEQTRG